MEVFKKPYADSPLRRSRVPGPISTPLLNDDEAERRQSRLNESVASIESTGSSTTTSDKEGLLNCLQIFNENKINKSNAWGMSLIDNFASLVSKHHKTMEDFQLLGTSLMASSKIYGLRVDSVHTEVVNMSNVLGRRKVTKNNENDEENDGEEDGAEPNANESMTDSNRAAPKPARRVKKKTGARCFIAKSKASLYAKLDTYPISDPTFVKLNSTIGELSSSHRMVNYLLPSVDSEIQHCMTKPFWDTSENKPLTVDASDEYAESQAPGSWSGSIQITSKCMLRPQLRAYKINHSGVKLVFGDEQNTQEPAIMPINTDLAFDINAECEPIPQEDDYMETGFDDNDMDELDDQEVHALRAVKNLQRPATVMEDMRPVDASVNLEYSYRPMDNIMKFWAGPSYWKINRRQRVSTMNSINTVAVAGATARKKTVRKKFEPIEFVDTDDFDYSLFIPITSKEAQRLRKVNVYKRWDPKKLKLPTNLHLDRNRYDSYHYAPTLKHEWSKSAALLDTQADYEIYENPGDQDYGGHNQDDDDDDDDAACTGGDNEHIVDQELPVTEHNETLAEIGTNFDGAPEQVEQIFLPFAKRAKVVDMKQLKRCCLNLILRDCEESKDDQALPTSQHIEVTGYTGGASSFNAIFDKLPSILTPDQAQALSRGTAFYSILHLAKENKLDLIQTSDSDFAIRPME